MVKNIEAKTKTQTLENYQLPPKKGHEKYGLDIPDEKVEEYLAEMRKFEKIKHGVEGRPVISKKIEEDDDYYMLGI